MPEYLRFDSPHPKHSIVAPRFPWWQELHISAPPVELGRGRTRLQSLQRGRCKVVAPCRVSAAMIRSRARGILELPEVNRSGSSSRRVRIRSAGGWVLIEALTVLMILSSAKVGSTF